MGTTKTRTKTIRGQLHKTCLKCGRFVPATTEHFYKGTALLGLGSICRACNRPQREVTATADEAPGQTDKECAKCRQMLPATREFFAPFGKGALGLHAWCRECLRKETDWISQFWKS